MVATVDDAMFARTRAVAPMSAVTRMSDASAVPWHTLARRFGQLPLTSLRLLVCIWHRRPFGRPSTMRLTLAILTTVFAVFAFGCGGSVESASSQPGTPAAAG